MGLENYAAMIGQFDPIGIDQKIAATREAQNANRLAEFAFAQKQREAGRQDELERITRDSIDEPTGRIDADKFRRGLIQAGDYSGVQSFEKSQTEQAKAKREAEKESLSSAIEKQKIISQYAGAARDQNSWSHGLSELERMGVDVSNVPREFSPQTAEVFRARSMTGAQQLEQVWKQKGYDLDVNKFDYQQKKDAADRDVTIRGQDITKRGQDLTDARGRDANDIARDKAESVTAKPLPAPVVKQLTEVRDNATTINNLASTFKKEYAGKGVLGFGADTQLDASARMGVDKDAVDWWKNYKKQAELVERHAMFGASLTPGEQASWRSADISPGMDSGVIERNLATRKALAQKVLENSTQDFIDAGHNPERITKIAGRSNNSAADANKPPPPADTGSMPSAKQIMVNGTKAQAQLAPDGHYYIKQANGKYARVN